MERIAVKADEKEKLERGEEKHKGEGKEGETKMRRNQYKGDGSKGGKEVTNHPGQYCLCH